MLNTGVGHGCSTLTQEIYRHVSYFMLDDEFFAVVTCVGSHVWNDDGHFDKHRGRRVKSIVLQCLGTTWNQSEPRCAGTSRQNLN